MQSRSALIARLDALAVQAISFDTFIDAAFGDAYNEVWSKLMAEPTTSSTYHEFSLSTNAWRQQSNPSVGRQVNSKILRLKISQLLAVLRSEGKVLQSLSTSRPISTLANAEIVPKFIDTELQSKCHDLFAASAHFHRAVAEATKIFELRLKSKLPELGSMTGLPLANKAVSPEPAKARLKFSDNASEQEGFANLVKGVIGAYRNPTHHGSMEMTRQAAFQVCGFIDCLLVEIERATIQPQP
jgi:uncharacterized protein (TIGR02391 family)